MALHDGRLVAEHVNRFERIENDVAEMRKDVIDTLRWKAEISSEHKTLVEGVSNFRSFQSNVNSFIDRQDQSALDLAKHLQTKNEEETHRRSQFRWVAGFFITAILGLCAFIGPKIWLQVTTLNRLEDDWNRYYQTPPLAPPVPQMLKSHPTE